MKRFAPVVAALGLVLGVATATQVADPMLYLNETDSMPRGVYRRTQEKGLKVGDVVLFEAPDWAMALARERGYLSPRNRFLKTVGATEGMTFCVEWPGDHLRGTRPKTPDAPRAPALGPAKPDPSLYAPGVLTIDGQIVGPVFARDSRGRPLPRIEACQMVPTGHFLPLSTHHERSFDGRYYGTIPENIILRLAVFDSLAGARVQTPFK